MSILLIERHLGLSVETRFMVIVSYSLRPYGSFSVFVYFLSLEYISLTRVRLEIQLKFFKLFYVNIAIKRFWVSGQTSEKKKKQWRAKIQIGRGTLLLCLG